MLSPHLKAIALRFISRGGWYSNFLGRSISFDREDEILIKWLIQSGRLEKNELESAIHKGLCSAGRTSALSIQSGSRYVAWPDEFDEIGYALMHRALTNDEILLLRPVHGETIESYIWSAYGLLDWAIDAFNKPYVEREPFIWPDNDSCCHHG